MNRSSHAATTAIVAAGAFLGLLLVAHLLKPEVDPATRFISELAIGRRGGVMQVAFLALATANVALWLAIRPWLAGAVGKAATALFLLGTFGTALAGVFVTDPVNTPAAAQTTSGTLHNLGGGLGLLGFLGTLLLAGQLLGCPAWRRARMAVLAATGILVAGFLYAFASIATISARSAGVFGPDTPVGWPNRIGILAGVVWIVVVGWQATRQRGSTS